MYEKRTEQKNNISLETYSNAMKWKVKWLPNNVTRDSVMLKRDFGWNMSIFSHSIISFY